MKKRTIEDFMAGLKSKRPQTEAPPMQYIYDNISTNNYIEFTLEGVKGSIPSTIALDIFFDRITNPKYTLPPSLMQELKQDDFQLFIDAAESESALEELERYIYVKKENETYRDTEGYIYDIVQRSKKEVILESADDGESVRFVVSSDDFILNQDSLIGALKYEDA
ncbi:MAG: hypothetical protein FAF04_08265 [Epsilonproteobacteria bacterium]|nr:hypothetical protein [Campylobacterota bacterium]